MKPEPYAPQPPMPRPLDTDVCRWCGKTYAAHLDVLDTSIKTPACLSFKDRFALAAKPVIAP